jgi:hypothetical protein
VPFFFAREPKEDSMKPMECIAKKVNIFNLPAWKICTEGLAPLPDGETPFCFSMTIQSKSGRAAPKQGVSAWRRSKGRTLRDYLGPANRDLTRLYAEQALTLVSSEILVEIAGREVLAMTDELGNHSYIIAACPTGMLIIAEDFYSVETAHGIEAVLGAIVAPDLSNHQALKTKAGLEASASAILQHQFLTPISSPTSRVTIHL